jgi:hypothetical protein
MRTFGGTIGLAQCGTVLDNRVRSYIVSAIVSGAISPSEIVSLTSSALRSLDSINSLPPAVAQVVKEGFREGVRWAFISLIPWSGVSTILTIFLSKIDESARQAEEKRESPVEKAAPVEEKKRESSENQNEVDIEQV